MNYPLPCLFPDIGGQFLLWNPMSPQVEVRSGHYAKCVCVCMSLCVSICFSNYTVKGQRGGLLSFISVPQVPTEQVIVTACGWKDVTAYDNHRWPPTKKSATRDGIDEKTGRASSWCFGGGVCDIRMPCSPFSPICLRSVASIVHGGGKTFSLKASFANFCY